MKIINLLLLIIAVNNASSACTDKLTPIKITTMKLVGGKYIPAVNTINVITITCTVDTKQTFLNYAVKTRGNYPWYLNLEKTTLTTVVPLYFQKFLSVVNLKMNNIHLKTITPGCFNQMNKLTELYIQGNEITEVTVGVFNALPALKVLNLSNNKIVKVHEQAFSGLTTLETLYIDNNKIVTFSENILKSQPKLNVLSVTKNSLKTLGPLKVNNLYANSNSLFDIKGLSSTTKLVVTKNYLATVKKGMFTITLLYIDLSFNVIKTIETDAFFNLKALTTLKINNNKITSLPLNCFKDLENLEILDISFNGLSALEYGYFDSLKKLVKLNLSYNNLTDLHQSTLHSLVSLQELNFKNNRISDFSITSMLTYHPKLKNLTIEGNTFLCKKLVQILLFLQAKNISLIRGTSFLTNNVRGIACLKNDTVTTISTMSTVKQITIPGRVTNITTIKPPTLLFNETVLYKFFNSEFINTQFYKYLQSFKFPSLNVQYNETSKAYNGLLPQTYPNFTIQTHSNFVSSNDILSISFMSILAILMLLIIVILAYGVCRKNNGLLKDEIQLM
ncbi:carboxypeptidase N subunit 2-like [Aethina tumida]|uniref:carboxypeptidase N subunit 2-like n=1 Tax=Aethina tumida TaxID=116153 RepID=UPI002148C07B|nr:carboxypeptidase N subunit 2-like [Aethina tumida]XP_049820008.1 carboxypeptidase N subunit 2-like [Aethina tumida]